MAFQSWAFCFAFYMKVTYKFFFVIWYFHFGPEGPKRWSRTFSKKCSHGPKAGICLCAKFQITGAIWKFMTFFWWWWWLDAINYPKPRKFNMLHFYVGTSRGARLCHSNIARLQRFKFQHLSQSEKFDLQFRMRITRTLFLILVTGTCGFFAKFDW